MSFKDLAIHLARLLEWDYLALNSNELDLIAHASEQSTPGSTEQIRKLFEKTYKKGETALSQASDEDLQQNGPCVKGPKH